MGGGGIMAPIGFSYAASKRLIVNDNNYQEVNTLQYVEALWPP